MTTKMCTHGLVQQNKFGLEQRDGMQICRGCGLPTPESYRARVAADQAQAPTPQDSAKPTSIDDRILATLTAIHRSTEEQNERLRKIWWALFAIWVPIILIFAWLWFGWFDIEFTYPE